MSDEKVVTGEQESPEEKKNKVEKRFNQSLAKLTAILNGPPSKNGKLKVPQSEVAGLVSDLFKEEHEALRAEVKEEIKTLLKQYVTMQREIEAKKKELEKVEQDQMKNFADAGEKLFNKIEGIPAIQAQYGQALTKLTPPTTPGSILP